MISSTFLGKLSPLPLGASFGGDITVHCDFKMSKKLKDKTKEDMSKVLDCSSFQIKPLQVCIAERTFGDFSLPESGI